MRLVYIKGNQSRDKWSLGNGKIQELKKSTDYFKHKVSLSQLIWEIKAEINDLQIDGRQKKQTKKSSNLFNMTGRPKTEKN